ncbi:tripartite tricarboxylate transporter TctB family protein [Chelatococcus sp. SYSU_G07232]|uniref:Tripartite tricarboxylate transporter TctB family protein n=1 Tax=Chelatococcus albus TaxID=3047466 RepID=A0ABT7AKF4_9HYPH|nr:tripartite tricarboxylate transporter TctB family protein [Chelatococcus sp. SYSU_G07232]MDJ1159833.1 tripartite tricarboxylate transporter TctB family protein [Chelatococcus sp. SYSU_G07232]
MEHAHPGRRPDWAALLIAVGLLALAGVVAWSASAATAGPGYARIGPNAASYVVAAGLAILGLATVVAAFRGDIPKPEAFDPMAVCLILAGLLSLIGVISVGGGFIIAVTLLFALTARAFGRAAFLTDLGIGAALGLIAYLGFTRLLSLSLPQGPLEHLF